MIIILIRDSKFLWKCRSQTFHFHNAQSFTIAVSVSTFDIMISLCFPFIQTFVSLQTAGTRRNGTFDHCLHCTFALLNVLKQGDSIPLVYTHQNKMKIVEKWKSALLPVSHQILHIMSRLIPHGFWFMEICWPLNQAYVLCHFKYEAIKF